MISSTSILGHSRQLAALEADLAQGNVAHAYVFSGPRHVGKFTIARWFAKLLLSCGVPEEGRTRAADDVDRLLHPDLLVIDQLWMEGIVEDMNIIARSSNISQQHRIKVGAKTDTIGIDDIRALQERLHEVRAGEYRCCLIRSVERMQDEPVNALLKILEEPHPGTVFLLTTQAMAQLLPTLVSRARVLSFAHLSESELLPMLSGVNEDDQQFLLRIAQGAPGIIRRLRDNPDYFLKQRQTYTNALTFWHSQSPIERLSLLEPLAERGEEADRYLLHLFLACREEVGSENADAVNHLLHLQRNLQTNVSRPLLLQQFVLALSAQS